MERVVGGGLDPPGIAKQNRNYPSNLDSRGEDKLASTPHSIGSYRSLTTEPELERRWTYQRRRKQQRRAAVVPSGVRTATTSDYNSLSGVRLLFCLSCSRELRPQPSSNRRSLLFGVCCGEVFCRQPLSRLFVHRRPPPAILLPPVSVSILSPSLGH